MYPMRHFSPTRTSRPIARWLFAMSLVCAIFAPIAARAECGTNLVVDGALQDLYDTRQFARLVQQTAVLRPNNENAGAILLRGIAQMRRLRFGDAYRDFTRAFELAPDQPNVAFHLELGEMGGYSGRANMEQASKLLLQASEAGRDVRETLGTPIKANRLFSSKGN